MSRAQRVRGQETEIRIVLDGNLVKSVTAIQSFTGTVEIEQKSEGYLGEVADRYDDIYKGFKGSLDYHLDDDDIFDFIQQLILRAQRRTPQFKVNILTVFNFTNGQRRKVQLNDIAFGNIPLNISSRSDYVKSSLDVACSAISLFK